MIDVLPTPGMWQVHLIQVLQCGEIAALGQIVRVVVGGEDGIDSQPFQLIEILGIRAGVGTLSPLPGVFEVVKQKFQIGQAQIGVAQ